MTKKKRRKGILKLYEEALQECKDKIDLIEEPGNRMRFIVTNDDKYPVDLFIGQWINKILQGIRGELEDIITKEEIKERITI